MKTKNETSMKYAVVGGIPATWKPVRVKCDNDVEKVAVSETAKLMTSRFATIFEAFSTRRLGKDVVSLLCEAASTYAMHSVRLAKDGAKYLDATAMLHHIHESALQKRKALVRIQAEDKEFISLLEGVYSIGVAVSCGDAKEKNSISNLFRIGSRT